MEKEDPSTDGPYKDRPLIRFQANSGEKLSFLAETGKMVYSSAKLADIDLKTILKDDQFKALKAGQSVKAKIQGYGEVDINKTSIAGSEYKGKELAAFSDNSDMLVFDLETGKMIKRIPKPLNLEGTNLINYIDDKKRKSIEAGEKIRVNLPTISKTVDIKKTSIADPEYSGKTLVMFVHDDETFLFSLQTGKMVKKIPKPLNVKDIDLMVFINESDRKSIKAGERVGIELPLVREVTLKTTSIADSQYDGKNLAAFYFDGTKYFYDLDTSKMIKQLDPVSKIPDVHLRNHITDKQLADIRDNAGQSYDMGDNRIRTDKKSDFGFGSYIKFENGLFVLSVRQESSVLKNFIGEITTSNYLEVYFNEDGSFNSTAPDPDNSPEKNIKLSKSLDDKVFA